MQQHHNITQKYKRQLKTEDFVILTQQNKEYKRIVNIMGEKEALLQSKVAELQNVRVRLQNQKEEYQVKCREYICRISQYELIREQLISQYKILKKEIAEKMVAKDKQNKEINLLSEKIEVLSQINLNLQQELKRKDLVISEMKESMSKMQKQIMDKKIKLFSNLIDFQHKDHQSKLNSKNLKNKKQNSSMNSNMISQVQSKHSSNINSISFQLASNDSVFKNKKSTAFNHNKSIFL